MSLKKCRFTLSKWPFEKGETVSVCFLTSPVRSDSTGDYFFEAYFRSLSDGRVVPVDISWGGLPEFWIGRKFMNGSVIIDDKTDSESVQIKLFDAHYYSIDTFRAFGIGSDIFSPDEYCVRFYVNGQAYLAPCIEIVRAFYAQNTIYANQLLCTEGFDDFIYADSWMITPVENSSPKLEFEFNSKYRIPLRKASASYFATLYGTEELREGYKRVFQQYNRFGKILAYLPRIAGSITASNIITRNNTHIIGRIQPHLIVPFSVITYAPASREKAGPKTKRTFQSEKTDGNVILAEPSTGAKKVVGESVESEAACFDYINNPVIHRRVEYDSIGERVKMIPDVQSDVTRSVGIPSFAGTIPPLNIDQNVQTEKASITINEHCISNDPDFSLIITAMNQLQDDGWIEILKKEVYDLSHFGNNAFVYIKPGVTRTCLVYTISFGDMQYTIFEPCVSDGYSISTAIIKTSSNMGVITESILYDLVAQKNWRKEVFGNMCYRLLPHHFNRTSARLAINMHRKLTALHG